MAILIKRYANRKLYNTESSRYITLKGIAALLEEGEEVRVVDNETGEDITQVALSQILVDNKRAHEDPSDTLLSQILSRGGDALYGAIKKSVDEASDGIGDFQNRFRQLVGQTDSTARSGLGFARDRMPKASSRSDSPHKDETDVDRDEVASMSSQLDEIVRESVTRAIESLDLPRLKDLEALSQNFERVAKAIERLERAYLPSDKVTTHPSQKTASPETK